MIDQLRTYQLSTCKKIKNIKIFILFAVLTVTVLGSLAFINLKYVGTYKANNNQGFAVVELFTSEGCSSCPPADDLVARVQKEYNDKPVYILAFHVDYWNRLGWKDVFSNADYSKRQHEYAGYLNLSSVYTPQIVVNGSKEFVGSENGTLHNAIKTALQTASSAQIVLNDVKTYQNHVKIHYQADESAKNGVLLLSIVQKAAQSQVKAGENDGRTLSHVQIVRKLQSTSLSNNKSGIADIALPKDFNPQNFEIIGLLQNTVNGKIMAAAKTAFSLAANNNAVSKI